MLIVLEKREDDRDVHRVLEVLVPLAEAGARSGDFT